MRVSAVMFLLPFLLSAPLRAQLWENQDDEYLLDLWTGSFSVDWEDEWDRYPTCFRLSVGCFNMQNLNTYYELKAERPLWRGLHFKYQYMDRKTLGTSESANDFYLDYRFPNRLYAELLMRPLFDKKRSDGGIGIGYWVDRLNYVVPYFILDDLDNNYSFTHARDKKIYTEQPYTLGFKSKWKKMGWFDYWIDAAYQRTSRAEYTYESFPDSNYVERRGESFLRGLVRFSPSEMVSLGVRSFSSLSFQELIYDSCASLDSDYRETIVKAEPFLTLAQGERFREELGFQIIRERSEDDCSNSSFARDGYLPTLLLEYRLSPQFDLHGAYVMSRVSVERVQGETEPEKIERTDNRVIFALQWNFVNKGRLLVRKGFDLDIKDKYGPFFYDKIYLHFLVGL